MSRADLRGADLSRAVGNNDQIKTIQTGAWIITYTSETMAIGCEQHSIKDWFAFDDETISKMDEKALDFWRKWKPILMSIMGVQS